MEKAIAVATPLDMIAKANESGASIEQMTQLFELQLKWEANEARKAFNEAIASFKAHGIRIIKDKKVAYSSTKYNHASLGNVVEQVTSIMSQYGLSHTWDVKQSDGNITVTCRIAHVKGHADTVSMSGEADNSGQKNKIQQIGSTITYLQRYTLLSALGLATYEDDDGRGGKKEEEPAELDPKIVERIEVCGTFNEIEAIFSKMNQKQRHDYKQVIDAKRKSLTEVADA